MQDPVPSRFDSSIDRHNKKMNRLKVINKALVIIDDLIDRIMVLFILLIFMLGAYFTVDSAFVFYNASTERIISFKPDAGDTAEGLKKSLSEDCIGWITLDDSPIDYPIMQGEDNNTYLNRNAYGEYSLAGSIYLDANNSDDFSDEYSLLYGHHMEGDYMFGSLYKWQDKEYFNKHLNGTVTAKDKIYTFKAFAFGEADATDPVIFNPAYSYPLRYLRSNADIFYEPDGDNILILSTCVDAVSNRRHILAGTLELNDSLIHKGGANEY